jgi:hypothetical protein
VLVPIVDREIGGNTATPSQRGAHPVEPIRQATYGDTAIGKLVPCLEREPPRGGRRLREPLEGHHVDGCRDPRDVGTRGRVHPGQTVRKDIQDAWDVRNREFKLQDFVQPALQHVRELLPLKHERKGLVVRIDVETSSR